MYRITYKEQYSENVFRLDVEAPLIARSRKAGNFVIVRVDEGGERIPLTISDSCREQGTIMLVVQRVGVSTRKLCDLNVGDEVADVVGPLGQATKIENFGTVVCAGGGVGVAPMLPIIKALKEKGNRVISVLAGRSKELIILEDMVRQSSDEVIIMTDDGSYGQKGLVTQGIEQVILREKVDKCFAIGPAVMMKFCCLLTKKYNIPTEVSLNTIMVDGTGMCGACRVTVGGRTRFVCVDGPEFDGHEVDFDEMMMRMKAYRSEEQSPAPTLQVSSVSTPGERTPSPDGAPSGVKSEMETLQSKAEERPSLSAKERMAIPRVVMPELEPKYRATKLREEVNKGLTLEMAQREAQRCLACKNPGCVKGCPVGIDIPSFIKHIEHGEVAEAAAVLKRYSALPAVCGRVCPQEKQCEAQCIHHKMKSQPVAIGYLERFAADWSHEANPISVEGTQAPDATGARTPIAVIGSGPAGLSFAGEMAARGYEVTVFEALHEIGGVLKYGIPEFRLPNKIVDHEIDGLRQLGVKFEKDVLVGRTVTYDDLHEQGFKGVFVGSGAGFPRFMDIPGEQLNGVMSSNEYLTRINLMSAGRGGDTPVMMGKTIAVIGGGNTAMDSSRTALRMGAERVILVYRRSDEEMPARREEIGHAKEEGVEFMTLHNPIEYLGDEKGHVNMMRVQRMELGEPDASGRRSPIPVEGAIEDIPVDLVIVAVGVSPNQLVPRSISGLEVSRRNTIVVNEETMQSNVSDLYAGGDIVRGGATVILAMGDGRRAALNMHEMLMKQ